MERKYYSAEYLRRLETTAKYPNRIKDRKKIETLYNLEEFGNNCREFFSLNNTLIAIGYVRIVYGDHGPYIEFDSSNIKCKLVDRSGKEVLVLPEEFVKYYYLWLTPEFDTSIKVYWQIKPVINLPDAPIREDGLPHAFNRHEGYADYRRGMYYVNPYVFDFSN